MSRSESNAVAYFAGLVLLAAVVVVDFGFLGGLAILAAGLMAAAVLGEVLDAIGGIR